MTVGEIKDFVMFQTNNDAEDVGEYEPYLLGYINEGYDRLVYAFAKEHIASDSSAYPPLADDADVLNLPEWVHPGVSNWATWCVYRSGNPAKQNRGLQFRAAAEEILSQIRAGSTAKNFFNIPR